MPAAPTAAVSHQDQTSAAEGDQTKRALRTISLVHQLSMEALLSRNRKELQFRMLNRAALVCGYDRASLWAMEKTRPRLLGVSGRTSTSTRESEQEALWRQVVSNLKEPERSRVLTEEDVAPRAAEAFRVFTSAAHAPRPLWLAVRAGDALVAGFLAERWEGREWSARDVTLMQSLMVSFGGVWEKLSLRGARCFAWRSLRGLMLVLTAFALALVFVEVPLRVAAPCEVTARDPHVVTAPLDGVVAALEVRAGQRVEEGELLFRYDDRVIQEELAVARQQVRIIQSNLKRVSNLAFQDPAVRSEIALLDLELEKEQVRLRLARHRAAQVQVLAPVAGRVVLNDPNIWRGRPVQVGEQVLVIVNPERTLARIWLALDDNIPFDPDAPVRIALNAFPERTLLADLVHVADGVSESVSGAPAVLAEAEWRQQTPEVRIGLQGSAMLQGQTVSLGYWLFRKPMAWTRKALGV